jgi:hypothetical protein
MCDLLTDAFRAQILRVAKRAGFKCLKKVQKGEYETIY